MAKVEKEEPAYKRIISYVVSILCLLLCLYITIEVISANTNHRPPRIFGATVSYVPTASMEPTIMAGQYILSYKTDFESVEVDDIIVYYNSEEDKYIVHRVIYKDNWNEIITTQGDNNLKADSVEVKPEMIYSKYVTTLGFMSIFTGGINQNIIFIILVAIFAIMLGMQLVSIFVKGKTDDIKKEQEAKKNLLREELRKQILEEELAKLRAQNAAIKEEVKEPEVVVILDTVNESIESEEIVITPKEQDIKEE